MDKTTNYVLSKSLQKSHLNLQTILIVSFTNFHGIPLPLTIGTYIGLLYKCSNHLKQEPTIFSFQQYVLPQCSLECIHSQTCLYVIVTFSSLQY